MTDILETMKAEIAEGMEHLRPHYPDDDDDALRNRAIGWRQDRYAKGRWPTDQEIAFREANGRPAQTVEELEQWEKAKEAAEEKAAA